MILFFVIKETLKKQNMFFQLHKKKKTHTHSQIYIRRKQGLGHRIGGHSKMK
jgi:hypothetical protein